MGTTSLSDVAVIYNFITVRVVPGPRSLQVVVPFILLPIALLIPPKLLSRTLLRAIFLPAILASQISLWVRDQYFDVVGMNHLLITFTLLGWYDVRKNFKLVHRRKENGQDRRKSCQKGELRNGSIHQGDNKVPSDQARDGSVHAESPKTSPGVKNGSIHQGDSKTTSNDTVDFQPYPGNFVDRLAWVLTLCLSLRLTDWHIGSTSHDKRQPSSLLPSQTSFHGTLTSVVLLYALLDLTSTYLGSSSTFTYTIGHSVTSVKLFESVLLGVHCYAALALFTAYLPMLFLLVLDKLPLPFQSVWSPLQPGPFGSLATVWRLDSSTWGLRAFWGRFWHQNMRYTTPTPGMALASCLKLNNRSPVRFALMTASAFFFSGMVHMGLVPPKPLTTDWGVWHLRLRIASFFWLQIIGVGIEIATDGTVRGFTKRKQPRTNSKVDGESADDQDNKSNIKDSVIAFLSKMFALVWTIGFLAASAWWTVRPAGRELGWWRMHGFPISVCQFVQGNSKWYRMWN